MSQHILMLVLLVLSLLSPPSLMLFWYSSLVHRKNVKNKTRMEERHFVGSLPSSLSLSSSFFLPSSQLHPNNSLRPSFPCSFIITSLVRISSRVFFPLTLCFSVTLFLLLFTFIFRKRQKEKVREKERE